MFGLKSHVGRHHPDYQPADVAGADPFEAMADRALPLYTPTDDPRENSLDEHTAGVFNMGGQS